MTSDEKLTLEEKEIILLQIDRRLKIRKACFVSLFSLVLIIFVLYAVSLERKIYRLSQSPAVVIYKTEEYSEFEETVASSLLESSSFVYSTESLENLRISTTETTSESFSENFVASESVVETSSFQDETNPQNEDVGEIYYVTSTGSKYHRSGCTYLSKSKIEITYDEVIRKGYKPCSRCIS